MSKVSSIQLNTRIGRQMYCMFLLSPSQLLLAFDHNVESQNEGGGFTIAFKCHKIKRLFKFSEYKRSGKSS